MPTAWIGRYWQSQKQIRTLGARDVRRSAESSSGQPETGVIENVMRFSSEFEVHLSRIEKCLFRLRSVKEKREPPRFVAAPRLEPGGLTEGI